MKTKSILSAVLVASSMLVAASLAQAKSLVYCSEGSPENFSPSMNTTGTSLDAARPVYNKLVQFAPGSTTVEPALAESYAITDDGKTITFKLRKGVKFHSGVNGFTPTRDLNADDVIWSFERMWKADHPYAKVSGGAYDYFNDMGMPDLLESITKSDDLTVVMKLKEPNAPIMANLAMDFATIHSAEYADFLMKKGTPEQFDQIPVGTGSFQFVDYQKDAVIRYKAFDGWAGKPKIDDLIYAITPDATARYAKLKANECQVMIAPNPADLDAMGKDADINLMSQAGLNIAYLSMQTQKPPFDKKEVRQAIAMAIDRDAILKEVYQGAGQKAKNPIPPTIWSYDDSTTDYAYAPAKAKEMLRTKVAAHPNSVEAIETGDGVLTYATIKAQGIDMPMPRCKIDVLLDEGDVLQVGDVELQVWHTPGHTTGQISFKMGDLLFCGDNIYKDSCVGVIDAHHGSHIPSFLKSLARIREDDSAFLLPSHGPVFRRDNRIIQKAIDRLTQYQYMADFGTCAIGWPLLDEWERDVEEGRMPDVSAK